MTVFGLEITSAINNMITIPIKTNQVVLSNPNSSKSVGSCDPSCLFNNKSASALAHCTNGMFEQSRIGASPWFPSESP